jgi:hypothetical protein
VPIESAGWRPTAPLGLGVTVRTVVITGNAQILARTAELQELAAASRQQSELADLQYFFERPSRIRYPATMVVLYSASQGSAPEKPVGAVVLFDSWFPFGPDRFYTAGNRRGRRTVFAPLSHRLEVAAVAAQALLERGARFVSIDVDVGAYAAGPVATEFWRQARANAAPRLTGLPGVAAEWALHAGVKRFDLHLTVDLDTTLAALGKKTRRNLRYYQRRCIEELGCRFVPQATLSRDEFVAFSRHCHYAANAETVHWRFDSLSRFSNVFLAGMQDAKGEWLALIAGRRNGSALEVDWQMNRAGHERLSLATVLRCFLIEHEVRAGSTSLSFEGGTSHQMAKSLRLRSVANLAVRRPSLWLRLAEKLLGRLAEEKLITKALVKPWRVWTPCGQPGRRDG